MATALDLVQRQRKLVGTTTIGSPAHRQASEVLALIEESYFLLSELHRVSTSASEVASGGPEVADRGSRSMRRRRVSPALLVVFVATIGIASVLLEIADPAPMTIQAGELVFP